MYNMVPETTIDLVFCILILFLGYMHWKKSRKMLSLYVAIAFGLFGISHFMTLVGIAGNYPIVLIGMRSLAYLLILSSLYTAYSGKQK